MKSLFAAVDAEFVSEEQAQALAQHVLSFATADETRVNISSGWSGNTRFAGNEITTSGGSTNTVVTVTSTFGKRHASSSTNVLDDESLKRTVNLAERLAKLSPEDPESMPELGAQSYLPVNGYFDSTAGLSAEARAGTVKQMILTAEQVGRDEGKMFVAGFLQANAGAAAVATSRGLFAYHRNSAADLSTTVRTPDATGSGWASGGARDVSLLDPVSLSRSAARKAVASRRPTAIEPGLYTVV